MCTIFRFGITLTVLIIFSKLLLSCSAAVTTQNGESITPSSLGTYTDGTILFATVSSMSTEYAGPSKRSFGFSGSVHGDANVTLHLLNVNEGFKHFGISCNCSELLDIRPLNPNYILLLIKEPPNILRVKVMDWTNKILSDMSIDGQIQAIGTSMNDTRFFVAGINATQLLCIEYTINNNGQIINGSVNKSIVVQPRMTIDQIISLNNTWAWGIVLKETLNTNYYNYYFLIISPETENLKPIKLNEDRIPIVFSQIACTSNNFQYYCLFISYNDLLWVKINNNFTSNNQTNLFQSLCFDSAKIYTMSDIGFLVEVKTRTQIKYMVLNIGIDYDDPNNAFGETVIDNNKDDFDIDPFILPNNTIVRILNKDNEFNFLSTKPSIPEKNQINGLYGLYNNTHIKETYPSNNELIPIGTDKINLTFIHTVDLTVAVNISIYLISGDENLLRQTLLCTNQYCKISDDGYSLTIELLENTFNTPNANYSVEIDDKFLRYRNESETIPGIKRGSWIIKTDPGSNNYDSDSTNDVSRYLVGIIHLTIGGTKYYHNLSRSEKNNFIKQMGIEISNSIPVNKSRLNILNSFIDYDTIDREDLLFIKFKIDPSADDSVDQKSAIHVFDDFTKLFNFNNNIQTYLDNNNYTRYIDKNFKPREASNLWDDIKINLRELMKDKVILTFLIFFIILLIASFIYGRYKNKEGSNFIFFKVTLIIVDIINDVSFVIEKKDYLRELLIPGIIFIVVPLLLNTFLAFNIFIFELRKNSKFKDWFEDHSIIIRIITLFASINVQLLHILDSNFAGISLFNSPFSPRALYWIFWGEIINIFILDIPHLLIQILYALAIETYYDNLAFFTLVTSFLILLTDIIGFIYDIFANKYEKLQKDYTEYMKELKKKEKNSL